MDNKLKANEKDVERDGEIKIHGEDAVGKYNELKGTPVDDQTPLEADSPLIKDDFRPLSNVEPPPEGYGRILIVVPILDITYDFFSSFLKFYQELTLRHAAKKLKYEIGYHFIYRKPVHIAETFGINIALSNKCTHVLFMDDDIYDVTVDMLDKLYEADKDVISGVMYTSGFPYAQCTFRRFDVNETIAAQPAKKGMYRLYEIPCRCPNCEKEGRTIDVPSWFIDFCPVCRKEIPKDWPVQQVDLIPFPFTLIKTDVFKKIQRPWFHCNSIFPTDSWFADRCAEAGIQEYAHMRVRLNHRGVTDLTRPYKIQEGAALMQTKGGAIQVSHTLMEAHTRALEAKMNEAEERMRNKVQPTFLKNGESDGK